MPTYKLTIIFFLIIITFCCSKIESNSNGRAEIEIEGGPDSVVWVVQLSDLHFSVHNPDRALDFKNLITPVLSFVNPSLVLITGDLTDGKSKDLSIMKQDEQEWVEYWNVMQYVVNKSGLDVNIFHDLRGNHDNFGVPSVGSPSDFFSKYSFSAQAGRSGNINSATLQTGDRRYLFVGIDSTMNVGLRGPTNLFGHPTDELLTRLDSELSQWDAEQTKQVTKVAFGHFPLSFSAFSESGRTLKDIFLKHSISAYLCGHLHTSFGRNLKRHHQPGNNVVQLNMHQTLPKNFSSGMQLNQEFWEWEMGDWRKSRIMRIMAIDRGHASFVDIDLKSGGKDTIIVPTFPLDSRLMWTSFLPIEYESQSHSPSHYMTIRALVFSSYQISSVVARVYDSSGGNFVVVSETSMTNIEDGSSRGALYAAPWNFKAFKDPSPQRYWLQIEAIDIRGKSTSSELRPFSINGIRGSLSWTWKELKVMGCQWAALYFPVLWFSLGFLLFILFVPLALSFFGKQYTFQNFSADKGFINGIGWVLTELYKLHLLWFGFLGYIFYLVLFPWFSGQIFTDGNVRGYMTYKSWVVKYPDSNRNLEYIGFPDVLVIVIPHIIFVVLPSVLVAMAFAVDREMYMCLLAQSKKKEDDYRGEASRTSRNVGQICQISRLNLSSRWIRKLLMVICLAILFMHFKSCRILMKAYEMNLLIHFPVYCFSIPLLLAYAVYKTKKCLTT